LVVNNKMALDSETPTLEFSFCQFFLFLFALFACGCAFYYLQVQQNLYCAQVLCGQPLEESLDQLLKEHLECKQE